MYRNVPGSVDLSRLGIKPPGASRRGRRECGLGS